ncbi:MAG TPA: 1-acyl-sn-glycerol-3-phosphate acyltransferase [Jatrophihabitans sp.]
MPPRSLRRVIIDALWLPIAIAFGVLLAMVLLIGVLLAPFSRERRLLRVAALAGVYLCIDVGLVLRSFGFWLRHPSPRRDLRQWREWHAALLGRALARLMSASRRLCGYQVELVGRPVVLDPSRPLIVLARHAGPGDSFTLVHLLITRYQRRPRVVLKAALQWDPGLDVVLTRLACYFLPSRSGAGEDLPAAVGAMAGGLQAGESLLVFPEGGNWTPRRHRRAVIQLLRKGRRKRAQAVRDRTHVLPPRPGGTVASLIACQDADVLVVAHCGLDTLVNPMQIWRAIPFDDRPMRIRSWLYRADSVPRDEAAATQWLDDRWAEIDRWIYSQRTAS